MCCYFSILHVVLFFYLREYLLVVLALGGCQGVGLSAHSLARHAVKPTRLEGHDFPGIDPFHSCRHPVLRGLQVSLQAW